MIVSMRYLTRDEVLGPAFGFIGDTYYAGDGRSQIARSLINSQICFLK